MCILFVQEIGLTVSVHKRNPNWCRSSGNKSSDSEVLEYNVHAGVQATLQVSPGVGVEVVDWQLKSCGFRPHKEQLMSFHHCAKFGGQYEENKKI